MTAGPGRRMIRVGTRPLPAALAQVGLTVLFCAGLAGINRRNRFFGRMSPGQVRTDRGKKSDVILRGLQTMQLFGLEGLGRRVRGWV